MIEKIKELSAKIKERVLNKSGLIGASVVILSLFGIEVEAPQITGVVEAFTTVLDNWVSLSVASLGLYETFRKEA